MPCEECGEESVFLKSVWISEDALIVYYYCEKHAPKDAERFEDVF